MLRTEHPPFVDHFHTWKYTRGQSSCDMIYRFLATAPLPKQTYQSNKPSVAPTQAPKSALIFHRPSHFCPMIEAKSFGTWNRTSQKHRIQTAKDLEVPYIFFATKEENSSAGSVMLRCMPEFCSTSRSLFLCSQNLSIFRWSTRTLSAVGVRNQLNTDPCISL